MPVTFTQALRDEYQRLFDTCVVRPEKVPEASALTARIVSNRARYETVARKLGMTPWPFVAVIHCMESSLSFTKHLHNGDPLTARTFHVPAGRPLVWNPPNDWESSADDALRMKKVQLVTDWSLPALLFRLESYNGLGYRTKHPEVLSPYLWSFSNQYLKGKFVADGAFDPNAVSKQCGAAVLLLTMARGGIITLAQSASATT